MNLVSPSKRCLKRAAFQRGAEAGGLVGMLIMRNFTFFQLILMDLHHESKKRKEPTPAAQDGHHHHHGAEASVHESSAKRAKVAEGTDASTWHGMQQPADSQYVCIPISFSSVVAVFSLCSYERCNSLGFVPQ